MTTTYQELIKKRDDSIDAREALTTTEKLPEARREYVFDHIVVQVGEGNKVRYFVRLYGFTLAESTVEPLENIPTQFVTPCWRGMKMNDTIRQLHGETYIKRRREVWKWLILVGRKHFER